MGKEQGMSERNRLFVEKYDEIGVFSVTILVLAYL